MIMNKIERLKDEVEFLKHFVQGLEDIKEGRYSELK